ncbi:unnamed protein product [Phytophthora fragariaefolia]|uniref:Unnamed protein product n=1 Tax=Phytophthora fragariaefolia TaxID=1490495 RepID=A0A9W6XIC0_9STRA|nr:unnamed protein product [Phytophthora fragariaefolia]
MEWGSASMFKNFDDSDEEYYLIYLARDDTTEAKVKHGGSVPGKRANKEPESELWGERLMNDYFGDNPTYDERMCVLLLFLFDAIVDVLVNDEECNYFVQRPDATGRLGFLPEQKVTCALRMLAYGASVDQLDELIRMGESTVLKTLKYFCESIIRMLGPDYLRKPTPDDLFVFELRFIVVT